MKENNITMILCAAILTGTVLFSPAVAEMKKVDEAELARTNASVTGEPVKKSTDGAEKGVVRPEKEQSILTFDKGTALLASDGSKALEGISLNLNISGQETWRFNFGAYNTNYYGGVTGVKTH